MKKTAITLLALTFLLLTPSLVSAEDSSTSGRSGRVGNEIKQVKQDFKESVSDLRVKSCEARVEGINKRSSQLTERAQKMEENFGAIAKRVEDYYTNKLVPGNVTVANYDDLVNAISTNKALVDSALAEAKSKASFDCSDLSTVKTKVNDYRLAMQKVISALKEYRTSVKNLIVAVRTAAGKVKPSPSPSPAQ